MINIQPWTVFKCPIRTKCSNKTRASTYLEAIPPLSPRRLDLFQWPSICNSRSSRCQINSEATHNNKWAVSSSNSSNSSNSSKTTVVLAVSNRASNPLSVEAQDLQLVLLSLTTMLGLQMATLETTAILDLATITVALATATVALATSNPPPLLKEVSRVPTFSQTASLT